MRILLIVAVATLLSGCTVGRYVTNVTSTGPNKISVEKCTTKAYGNFYWNTECSSNDLTLTPPAK